MKFLKFAVAAVFAATFSNAYAFHSGGVAECEGCHSMHNSFDGSPNVTGRTFAQGTGIYLLKANDQSGACLNCHQAADTAASSYHISTAGVNPYDSTSPVETTPGGDFAWLKKTMNVIIRKTTALDGNPGERHGHNVIAADFGYVADSTLTVAPGGTYPAANLACSSCHDPHGKYRRDATGAISHVRPPHLELGLVQQQREPHRRHLGGRRVPHPRRHRLPAEVAHRLLRLRQHGPATRSSPRPTTATRPLPRPASPTASTVRVVRQLPRLACSRAATPPAWPASATRPATAPT